MPDSRPLFAKLCETVSYVNVFAYAAGPMSGCAVSRTGEVDESEAVHRNTPRIVRRGGEVQNDGVGLSFDRTDPDEPLVLTGRDCPCVTRTCWQV
jgi:hypothetical protein